MRQCIKGDGSDGTAALKAYLATADEILAQELYEFAQAVIGFPVAGMPRNGPEWVPRSVTRTTTFSPSAIISSTVK